MNWAEFKELVDKKLEDIGVNGDAVDIEYIDVSYPITGRVDVFVCEADPHSPNFTFTVTSHS